GVPGDVDPGRRHWPGGGGGNPARAGRQRRGVRLGPPGGRHRGRRAPRRRAAGSNAGLGAAQRRRAEGADHDPGRRRVPQRQRRVTPLAGSLRQPAPGQDDRGCPERVRRHRPGDRAREHGRPLRRGRVRHRHRRSDPGNRRDQRDQRQKGPGRRGGQHQVHHSRRLAADLRVRVQLRPLQWSEKGDGGPQGQHHEVHRRAVPSRRAAGRRRLPGDRVQRPDRRQHVHAVDAETGRVRCAGDAELVRRHRQRPGRRDGRRSRRGAERQHRRRGGGVRADPRFRPQPRRQKRGEPGGDDPGRGDDAAPPRRAGRRRARRAGGGGGDRGRGARDLRPSRRPGPEQGGGHERDGGRDHRAVVGL
ncbi:MAG: Isocitrate dehydrogenase [NAD], partial [uncultured Thermomicrobiales bacterium]